MPAHASNWNYTARGVLAGLMLNAKLFVWPGVRGSRQSEKEELSNANWLKLTALFPVGVTVSSVSPQTNCVC